MLAFGGRIRELTYCKQDEVLLVVLAHAVVDPGTVVVHLPNAPLTNTEKAQRQTFRAVLTGGCCAGCVWRGAREAALGPAEPRCRPGGQSGLFTVETGRRGQGLESRSPEGRAGRESGVSRGQNEDAVSKP